MTDLIAKGGPLMWPLLFCSVVALAVVLERVAFVAAMLWRKNGDMLRRHTTPAGWSELATLDNVAKADYRIKLLHKAVNAGRGEAVTVFEQVAGAYLRRLSKGMTILDTIVTVAPLLGILGTVLGIIESFDLLGQSGIANPHAVVGGIAQALITTAAGLTVALLALLPYNYLLFLVRNTTNELNELAAIVRKRDGGHP